MMEREREREADRERQREREIHDRFDHALTDIVTSKYTKNDCL